MKIRLYKTGDPCPCCNQPIKATDPDELLEFSMLVDFMGIKDDRIPVVDIVVEVHPMGMGIEE